MEKKIFKKFITPEEGESLLKLQFGPIKNNNNPIISRIVDKLIKEYDCKIKSDSYCRIEKRKEGHPWHMDTGSTGHMKWCEVGATILLKNSSSGGDTYYADDKNGTNKTKAKRDIYDLVSHASDVWHMVEKNSGERTVLLMFL